MTHSPVLPGLPARGDCRRACQRHWTTRSRSGHRDRSILIISLWRRSEEAQQIGETKGSGSSPAPTGVSLPRRQPSVPCGSARCTHDPYRPEREKLCRIESASNQCLLWRAARKSRKKTSSLPGWNPPCFLFSTPQKSRGRTAGMFTTGAYPLEQSDTPLHTAGTAQHRKTCTRRWRVISGNAACGGGSSAPNLSG